MEFGTFSFTIMGGFKKMFLDPQNTHTNNFGGYKSFSTPQIYVAKCSKNLPVSVFRPPPNTHTNNIGRGIKKFLDPQHTLIWHVNISWNLELSVLQFWGGIKSFRLPNTHTS